MKRIAITGSSGFVGKFIKKSLKQYSVKIIEIDQYNNIDLLELNDFYNVPKFDVIIHLAANSYVPASFENPWKYYHDNYVITLNVLEIARKYNAKVIYFSSYLYGEPDYLPIDEIHLLKPHNPYAQTKLICEKLCEGYNRDFNVPIVIFRPFNIYGKGQSDKFLIPSIIKQINNNIIKLKDSRPRRDFIHVNDVVDATLKAIDFDTSKYEVFNLGSGVSHSIIEIVNLIQKNSQRQVDIIFSNEIREGEVLETIADISKAKQLLKWSPKIRIEYGISEMLDNIEGHLS